ncbi:MAG TPA: alpha/beta hydrolase [Chitinophagaceae bacterium]|nr:alpha/beta hydrolase [Chitinophagaceae bacterium]
MKAYFISGLGADRRVFYRIQLPGGYEAVHLDWLDPMPNENFSDYAKRFSALVQTTEDFILIGLSFGGMLVAELGKILSPKKIIIISSVSCYRELPWYFRLAGKLNLQKIISPSIYKQATLFNRFMGPGDEEMKKIVYEYVRKTDPNFIRWSLNEILHWNQNDRPTGLIHIHGSNDHLLPCRYTRADYIVQKGGHLMVLNRAQDVNRILKEILEQY